MSNADLTWDERHPLWSLTSLTSARLAGSEPAGAFARSWTANVMTTTRDALHAVAEWVVAPARRRANGKIGLRYTMGGFGTPFFGPDEQVRVAGSDVVVVRDGREHREPVTTIAAAARLVGIEPGPPADLYQPTTSVEPELALAVDPDAAQLLGDWFGSRARSSRSCA